MLFRSLLLFALAPTLLAADAPPDPADLGPAENMARFAVRKLEAVVEECPGGTGERWPDRQVLCAAFPKSYSFFKMAWEDVVGRRALPVEVEPTSPWKLRRGRFERSYEADGHPFTVTFDERSGRLAVAFDASGVAAEAAVALAEAIAEEEQRGPDAPMAGFAGVGVPEVLPETIVLPEYPEEARVYRTSGQVSLQILVRADGSVGEVKVVNERPEGLGFADSCIEAVRQWRYRPATKEGAALDVWHLETCDYELR